jgi:hypothetical protein
MTAGAWLGMAAAISVQADPPPFALGGASGDDFWEPLAPVRLHLLHQLLLI